MENCPQKLVGEKASLNQGNRILNVACFLS